MDKVLMFSSGMDSLIMKNVYKFNNDQCIFVRMGTNENSKEENIIDKDFPGTIKLNLPISSFELPNKIIPFRNHFFALLGAQYSSKIYFAFTAGDTTKDKDFVFKSQMEGVLNYFASSPDKVKIPNEQYIIEMPFKNKTKKELVKLYIDNGFKIDDLINHSSSCYEGNSCGICRSCLRKYVALKLNGIECEKYFLNNPQQKLQNFYEECIRKNRGVESEEVAQCIKLTQQ
jgi:7-cyano-7-deazaguanine synthase in queuosine biosynthesis